MNRRTLLKLTLAGTAAAVAPAQIRGVVASEVANFDGGNIVTLSDGNLRMPLSFMFPEVPEEELKKELAELLVEGEFVEPPLNLTLLRDGNRLVLFDVGSGPTFMPSAGKLAESLEAANIPPDAITDVIFTHGHPDHLWGILDDFDEVVFPNAALHVPRTEFDFWRDANTVDQMPEARKVFAVGAKTRFEAMEEQINLFDPGSEVIPNVEAVDTRGHTPGHTSYVIRTPADPVMVIGDALTNPVISFQKPEWPTGSDQDPDQGIKTRKMLLDRLVAEQMKFIGYHLPNEGVGRVEQSGNAFRFIPV